MCSLCAAHSRWGAGSTLRSMASHYPREAGCDGGRVHEDHITTIVIQNIPLEYTQDELIHEVSDVLGSSSVFDFFYLPWDDRHNGNVGYAFVNFLDQILLQTASHTFSNYRFTLHNGGKTRKLGKVSEAHIQGLENLIWHFQECALEGRRNGPIVVWSGHKIELSKVFEQLKMQAVGNNAADAANGRSTTSGIVPAQQVGVVNGHMKIGRNAGLLDMHGSQYWPDGVSPQNNVLSVCGTGHVHASSSSMALSPMYLAGSATSFAMQGCYAGGVNPVPQAHPGFLREGLVPQHHAGSHDHAGQPCQGELGRRQLRCALDGGAVLPGLPPNDAGRATPARWQALGGMAPASQSASRACVTCFGGSAIEAPGSCGGSDGVDAGVIEITVPSADEDALRKFAWKFGHSF